MRPFIALFLTFFLALSPLQVDGLQALCADRSVPESDMHACCHQKAPDCNTGAMSAAYCCQPQVPSPPVPASQALPPAPSASVALLTPGLPVIEHLAGDPLLSYFAPVPPAAPPLALYQLHRAYRI